MTKLYEFYPLILVGAIIGVLTLVLTLAFLLMKDKKTAIGFERYMKDSEVASRLLAYAKPYWANFLLVLLLMVFSIAYDIISPFLIGKVEDLLVTDFEIRRLSLMLILYASMLLISMVSTYFQAMVLQKTGQKIISRIREDLFVHLESLSHAQLNGIPVGTLVTRLTNDVNSVSMMFTNLLVNMVKNTFVVVGVLIAMFCLNYMLTLMVLCIVPFIFFFTLIFRKFSRRAYRMVKDGTTDINIFLSENLSGMKIIQIFNREQRKLDEFKEKNDRLDKAKSEQILVFGIFRPTIYMLYISSILLLFFFSGRAEITGAHWFGQVIGSGTVVSFYMYISKFFNPIQNLAEQFNRLQAAFASGEKIFTLFDKKPELVDEPDAIELEHTDGRIEFKHVWFRYIEDEWVLKDLSFTVEAGSTVAFVGATGSGKTTILSLLCRNYDVQEGEILIDGVNIKRYTISSLRRHFGQMLQDVFLFAGTVRSNIVLREDGFTEEQIEVACRYVNADHFINQLKDGLDEEVRERGNNFSAGQRQLLSFARTVIHRPEIMILDEATANIDTETELLIQDSLEKMMNIGTMLMVAHRLSTIQHADNIIYLAHGRIVEQGTHEELLALKGRYYQLYSLQFRKDALLAK